MKVARVVAGLLVALSSMSGIARANDERAEMRAEERAEIQGELFNLLADVPGGTAIRGTFERFLSGDASVGPALVALTVHANEDVARYAVLSVGWVGGPESVLALRDRFLNDTRPIVRGTALTALTRTGYPGAAGLAVSALSSPDEILQMAGIGALKLVGSNSDSQALLDYLNWAGRAWPPEATFETLEKLGDSPGSSAVRTRLGVEANKKANEWDTRVAAAESLRRLGHGDLAAGVLNRVDSERTYERMLVVDFKLRQLARQQGVLIQGQGEVQQLLAQVTTNPPDWRQDLWGRSLRAKYLSPGRFATISDGPDGTPDTTDDLSTEEAWAAYAKRRFQDLF